MGLKELKASITKKKIEPFFAVILGTSSSGKSYLCGTLRKPTLFLYLSTESHGWQSASSTNDKIIPVCLDIKEQFDEIPALDKVEVGARLTEDQTLVKLYHYSTADLKKEGIEAVIIDSLSDLEQVIKNSTSFKQACLTDKGKHNKFAESEVLITKIRDIVINLQANHRNGVHVLVTCAAVVQTVGENGAAETVMPKLSTYGTADLIPRLFPDVLLCSRIKWENQTKHVLVFDGNCNRVSKDLAGNVTKHLNFGPRITGCSTEELPDLAKADLSELFDKFKKKEVKE